MDMKEEKSPAQWALDLLEPNPEDYKPSFLNHYLTFFGSLVGFSTFVGKNVFMKRPLYSQLHLTVIGTVVGGVAGYVLQYAATVTQAREDEMMRQYIRLHPERFPEPENRKYADIFRPWTPIR